MKIKIAASRLFLSGIFLFSIFFQNPTYAKIEIVLGNLPLGQNPNLALKVPETLAPEIILSREQYVISYNKDRRSPNWVAWKLEANQMGSTGRSNNFMIDGELENYLEQTSAPKHAVDSGEYRGSCYDRGHQIPSADRTDVITNNEATFLMSNMLPQTPYLNRVIWEHLESYTRNLVRKQGKKVYIIAGPIYDKNFGAIGQHKDIPVPSKNFKIIFILNANQDTSEISKNTPNISVIMPNILQDGSTPVENPTKLCEPINIQETNGNDWEKYRTTVGEIEKVSGLRIFP